MIPSNLHPTVQSTLLDPNDIRFRCFLELIMMFYLRYVVLLHMHNLTCQVTFHLNSGVAAYTDMCLRNESTEISCCPSWRVCSFETGSNIPVVLLIYEMCMYVLTRDGITLCVRLSSARMPSSWTPFSNGNIARLIISADPL